MDLGSPPLQDSRGDVPRAERQRGLLRGGRGEVLGEAARGFGGAVVESPVGERILVIWLMVWNTFIFPYNGNFIIPIDELIFFRGVQTTKQMNSWSPKIFQGLCEYTRGLCKLTFDS